jgi:hypothetical protein
VDPFNTKPAFYDDYEKNPIKALLRAGRPHATGGGMFHDLVNLYYSKYELPCKTLLAKKKELLNKKSSLLTKNDKNDTLMTNNDTNMTNNDKLDDYNDTPIDIKELIAEIDVQLKEIDIGFTTLDDEQQELIQKTE